MTTNEIDKIVHDFIIAHDAYPTAIGFMGFPKSLCTSVNEGNLMKIQKIFLFIKLFVMEYPMRGLYKTGTILI
jgi:hypothetical protein